MSTVGAPVRFPDRYENARLVATGGMGQVYCARDTVLGRVVAIKLLDDRFSNDPSLRMRFEREAWAAAQLSSDPNTVMIYDVGECDGRPFIVMEYLPGGSIHDVLRAGAPPVPRALDWLRQAAAALDHAHTHEVVHRDVKPANLLLAGDGRIKVADFGVASAAGLESLTQTGTIIGTAGYLSPEQAEGNKATSASDRYSLGVVGFELLAGCRPFERRDAASEAAAHAHLPVPSISMINPELPPEMDAVFERALAKDPAARFPTCEKFVAALGRADAASPEPMRIITLPSTSYSRRRSPRMRLFGIRLSLGRQLLVLFGMAAAAAGVVAAILLVQSGREPSVGTVLRVTVTEKGTTVLRTVTEQSSPPPTTPPTNLPATTTEAASAPSGAATPSTIALQGYARMGSGDYAGAIPLLERAATGLNGTASLAEAYNDYNLALSLTKTQGCSARVLQLLDASQAIQGPRKPINDLREACTQ
jgi:serine/threonine-protein kinase